MHRWRWFSQLETSKFIGDVPLQSLITRGYIILWHLLPLDLNQPRPVDDGDYNLITHKIIEIIELANASKMKGRSRNTNGDITNDRGTVVWKMGFMRGHSICRQWWPLSRSHRSTPGNSVNDLWKLEVKIKKSTTNTRDPLFLSFWDIANEFWGWSCGADQIFSI